MSEPGDLRRRELDRVELVIVPAAQVDRVAFPAAFGHAHDVDEEAEAVVRFGSEEFEMGEVSDVERA
ncbi:hypothetical protein D3C83_137540 [compost metagenome]